MRIYIGTNFISLWLSAQDTYSWARKPGAVWPCSQLSGKRLFAQFDRNGLCSLTVNGSDSVDVDATEFNAITSDFLALRVPKDHPNYLVCVGQFKPNAPDPVMPERAPFESNVSSQYGAPMGRRSDKPSDLNGRKVKLQRVRFVDGDYDAGGAYWGGGTPLFCAWDDEFTVYLRANSREEAKRNLPGALFYR